MTPPAILHSLDAVGSEPSLQTRGDSKLVLTELYSHQEDVVREARCRPEAPTGRVSVLVLPDSDNAVFSQHVKQARNRHQAGTEFDALLEKS